MIYISCTHLKKRFLLYQTCQPLRNYVPPLRNFEENMQKGPKYEIFQVKNKIYLVVFSTVMIPIFDC